jgi:glutamate-1-semialdehyde 2,1-aminomutase
MKSEQSRYKESIDSLRLAEEVIPLGSQTFSKSPTQYPRGISPHFISKATGAYVWDLDGNKYVDLVNSLASITLGYGDKRVNKAVKKQLKQGVIYSLPGILEAKVANLIVNLVPSAEMVRFAKNGTDATAAAIRLSRAFTGRDHIAFCGYHGWQDWYIGTTTKNKGVPKSVIDLSHQFKYNDISSLERIFEKYPDQVAGVILEPMNSTWPENNFLQKVKELTYNNNAILTFDETITGFRYAPGGAQELFNVIPDLTTLGKGIANGYPLSVITGRRDVMEQMQEIFFSGTFGGELLSLSAAETVLKLHISGAVSQQLADIGESLTEIFDSLIEKYQLGDVLSLTGHPTWKIIKWEASSMYDLNEVKTLFLQEMFKNGVLVIGSHNVSLAIGKKEISIIQNAYEETFKVLAKAIKSNSVISYLEAKPLIPLFSVR